MCSRRSFGQSPYMEKDHSVTHQSSAIQSATELQSTGDAGSHPLKGQMLSGNNTHSNPGGLEKSQSSQIMDQLLEIQLQLESLAEADSRLASSRSAQQEVSSSCATPDTFDLKAQLESLHSGFEQLRSGLQGDIGQAVERITETQSAAASNQSAIIRTLTEAVFSSSAGTDSREQLTQLFSEFESRICSSIRDAIEASGHSNPAEASPESTDGHSHKSSAQPPTAKAAKTNPRATGEQTWDDIRRALMSESTSEQEEVDRNPAAETVTIAPTASVADTQEFRLADADIPLEIPEPVDIDALDIAELRQALRERERLICSIIGRLRRQSYTSHDMLTTEQLRALMTDMPDEFATRVNFTLRRIDDQLRLGELELSLERARLARQASQLDFARQQVEHNARQMGYTINPDGTLSADANMPPRGSGSRRWLGKLGFGE